MADEKPAEKKPKKQGPARKRYTLLVGGARTITVLVPDMTTPEELRLFGAWLPLVISQAAAQLPLIPTPVDAAKDF